MELSSVSKNLDFVEHYATYRKKTAHLGCFTQYIVFIFNTVSINLYVHHADLNQALYAHHQNQHEYQRSNRLL